MKKYRWLNQGKLRASWGQVGNDSGSGYYAYYGLYGSWTQNSKPAYVVSQNPARDLHWETGESWGAAVEGRLFNRLNLSVEYFDKRNKDLIFQRICPQFSRRYQHRFLHINHRQEHRYNLQPRLGDLR